VNRRPTKSNKHAFARHFKTVLAPDLGEPIIANSLIEDRNQSS